MPEREGQGGRMCREATYDIDPMECLTIMYGSYILEGLGNNSAAPKRSQSEPRNKLVMRQCLKPC